MNEAPSPSLPKTNVERLRKVFEALAALGDRVPIDTRLHILALDPDDDDESAFTDRKLLNRFQREHLFSYSEIRTKFGLPFSSQQYRDEFTVAEHWLSLREMVETNRLPPNAAAIRDARMFRCFDSSAVGRLAAWRVEQELIRFGPVKPDEFAPSCEQVRHVLERLAQYKEAREQANRIIWRLIDLPKLAAGRELPFSKRAGGTPNLPQEFSKNVPRYRYIARLLALGLCSKPRQLRFFCGQDSKDSTREQIPEFLTLAESEQQDFVKILNRKTRGSLRSGAVLPWLCDNWPVFTRFLWRSNDISDGQRFVFAGNPVSASAVRQAARREKFMPHLKEGALSSAEEKSASHRSIELLTPKPELEL